jgi:tRNA A37 methylthiotransferase MiaB
VEIGSGCVGNCRYCIIKKAKGKPVSRKPEDILNDIAKIYSPGKQLDLVADDCGCYGIDLGTSLPELLLTINDKHPDISMDITYLSPWWLTKQKEEYIRIFKELNINSINISMQSGSDKVLAGMNRNYTVQEILGIIEKLKSISPQTGFWTHIMVGFPGEVWSDFWKTLVMATHFYAVHAFAYSPRRGTESAALKNNNGKFTITLRYGIALIFAKTNSFLKIVKEIIKKNPLNISSEY